MGTLLCVMLSYCGVSGSPGGWTLRLSAIIIVKKTLRVEQRMLGFKQMFGQRGGAGLGVELEEDVTVSLICVVPFASH